MIIKRWLHHHIEIQIESKNWYCGIRHISHKELKRFFFRPYSHRRLCTAITKNSFTVETHAWMNFTGILRDIESRRNPAF